MIRPAKIFEADSIKTQISQAVSRDMNRCQHEYGNIHSAIKMLSERQRTELTKKYVSSNGDDIRLEKLTYEKFSRVNDHMSNFTNGKLGLPEGSSRRPHISSPWRDRILLKARDIMRMVLTPFQEDEWFQYCKHGTGSSLGVSYKDTSMEAKSKFPVTITSSATTLFDRYLEFDSQLNSALLYHNEATPTGVRYDVVEGSRATTVPKNDSIRRMIAIEPTGNMFLQQGLMSMMYARMRSVGLDVESLPDTHRERAQLSSITSSEATIDWSSASDCVSEELLSWLLPPLWFECCKLVRSPVISIGEETVELNMFSTMGNAVTFPLETLVFWSLAHATVLVEEGVSSNYPDWDNFDSCSVFGDDCIVPTKHARAFIRMCESVGFIVNEEKSFFNDEGFRESCGGDYLRGRSVRPFCMKGPTSRRRSALEPWLYIIANSLIPKYIQCFGARNYIYDRDLFKVLFALFEENAIFVKIVPPHYPDDAGLKISFDLERFVACYPMKLSRVGVDRHGSYTFRYCRFNYKHNTRRVDDLHYATWLKQPGGRRSPWWHTRRKGGYVVAKGQTAHWTVPNVVQVRRPA